MKSSTYRYSTFGWTQSFRLLSLALFMAFGSLFAQGFQEAFGGPKEDQGQAVLQLMDHGYLVIGFSEGQLGDDNDMDLFAVRTDVDGTVIWTKQFDEGYIEQGFDAVETADGNYAIVGQREINVGDANQVYLIKIDPRGDVIWSRTYPNQGVEQSGRQLTLTDDGGFLITGETQNPPSNGQDALVIKVDENGLEQWRRSFGTNDQEVGVATVVVPNGFILGARIRQASGTKTGFSLSRLSENGTLQWTKVYGEEDTNENLTDLLRTQDDQLIAVGTTNSLAKALMLKVDLNGDTTWVLEIDASDFEDEFLGVIEEKNGDLVAVGQTLPTTSDVDVLLVKVSADGQLIFQRRLGDDETTDIAVGIAPTVDGGYVITGYTSGGAFVLINDMTLFKVDGEGTLLTNHLRGTVFHSQDGCNDLAPGDQGMEGWLVRAESPDAVYFGSTLADGSYDLQVGTGTYTVSLLQKNNRWNICNPVALIVDFVEDYDSTRHNFPLTPAINCALLEVELTATPAIACQAQTMTVHYANQGSAPAIAAYVELDLDAELTFVSAGSIPTTIDGQQVTFAIGDLAIGEQGEFNVQVDVACTGVQNLQGLSSTATILPATDCDPIDPDWDQSSIQVSGTCEGDSVAFLIRNVGIAAMSQVLEYVVVEDYILRGAPQGFILAAQEQVVVKFPTDEEGSTFRLIAEQSPGHPGENFPTVALEGCTENFGDDYTTGAYAQFPDNDGNLNIDILTQEVAVLPVPGDDFIAISAYPKGFSDTTITQGTDLEYTVYFTLEQEQNYERIVIRDTLSSLLDFNSLQMGAASHPYDFEIYADGVLKITFDSIHMQPGDGTGVEPSDSLIGYVSFRLSQKPMIQLGSVISNSAVVYFDNNAPRSTPVVNRIIGCENIFSNGCLISSNTNYSPYPGVSIAVGPNPFKDRTTVRIDGWENPTQEFRFILRDALGRTVRSESFSGTTFVFQPTNLPKGGYFFEVLTKSELVGSGAIVVQ
ncbi:MAG: hypothetical protein WBA17_07740 [Saprospiraceae bacterium]